MTVHSFPALGFDPAPGEPDELERLGADCRGFASELSEDGRQVRALRDGFAWSGPAADAFRGRLDDLPRELDRSAEAYREAGHALAAFSAELRGHQMRASALEADAADLRRRADAEAAANPSACATLTASGHSSDALTEVLASAHRLREQTESDAGRCNRALHHATRHAPPPPGWFSHALGEFTHFFTDLNAKVGAFVRAHAGEIANLANIASKISSALAVVAMLAGPIPILGQAVATVALAGSLVAGGLALVGHTALATYAGGSWTPVLLDAAALVTAGAGKGAEAVGGKIAAAKGLEMTEESFHGVRGALGVLRHPGAAWTAGASATMTFPTLVTRTVSYQFDLAGGALGTFDLAQSGQLGQEADEARHRAYVVERAPRGLSTHSELRFRRVATP